MRSPRFIVWLIGLLVIVCASQGFSQSNNFFNQRDDTYRLLGLKRAKQAYESMQADFDRKKQLYEKKLITELEYQQARALFTDAEVNYQQSLLAVVFEQQYITVSGAVKYQAPDGSKHVRLTIENSAGGTAEFQKLIEMKDDLFRSLQPDVVNNVYVSILNDNGAMVSQPYEAKIDMLRYGHPVELDFTLLQDLDAVNVYLVYANGSQRSLKLWLQKDGSVDQVAVQSEQFSQEIELGKTASFDLTLELFSGTSNTFSLVVVNLTQKVGRYFKDPSGSARLSQVKFTESTRAKKAALSVTLPDRPSEDLLMDEPIPFFVLVLPRAKADTIKNLYSKTWSEEEIKALEVGYVRLELIPRGVGELRVTLPQLFHSIDNDSSAWMRLKVENEGSHVIDNVELRIDLPLNWTKTMTPSRIESLEIRDEGSFDLAFKPPDNVAPGKYEIRIRTSGMSNGQPITTDNKTVTVEIRTETNMAGTVTIIFLLLGLVGGIVFFGMKLSRR